MISKLFQNLLELSNTDTLNFPPTLLYNEGWLLRIILDWLSYHTSIDHPLSFKEKSRWYSEALLPSAFKARFRGDSLAEASTHLDGVIGHFKIGDVGKSDLSLLPNATQFIALEAKMFSGLSAGVKNAKYFDQAARNIGCITEVLRRANRHPSNLEKLGFYVLAPQAQITKGIFNSKLNRDSIKQKVERRVSEFKGDIDKWYSEWFKPTIEHIDIGLLGWEELIECITVQDENSGLSIGVYYEGCLEFNR